MARIDVISKMDLHIHSFASSYKEDIELVKNSKVENLDILFKLLNENQVNLISFTDHNRFDLNLFNMSKELIETGKYPSVKNILPGVEVDVDLEENGNKCQMCIYFDYKNQDDLQRIAESFSENADLFVPKNREDKYNRKQLLATLNKIGLGIIIIVSQTSGLNNKSSKKSNSNLSDATDRPLEYIEYNFFDALEFSSTSRNNEGVLNKELYNSLKRLDFPLITKSDCHEWAAYPWRDLKTKEKMGDQEKSLTKIKSLPTFLGLKLALSSSMTRIKKIENNNKSYIREISWNGKKIPLSKGINVIVGDNSSGKSALFSKLSKKNETIYSEFYKDNQINIQTEDQRLLSIVQGFLSSQPNNDNDSFFNLLQVDNEIKRDHSLFESKVKKLSKEIESIIRANIRNESLRHKISSSENLNVSPEGEIFFITIDNNISAEKNPYEESLRNFTSALLQIEKESEKTDVFSKKYINKIENIKEQLTEIKDYLVKKNNLTKFRIQLVNVFKKNVNKYNEGVNAKSDSKVQSTINALKISEEIKNNIITYIKEYQKSPNSFPVMEPFMIEPFTYRNNGFVFTEVPNYSNMNLTDLFYEKVFVKDYSNNKEKILKINSRDELSNSIYGSNSTDENTVWKKFQKNIEKFRTECTNSNEKKVTEDGIGEMNCTPGGVALAFFKYKIEEARNDYDVLLMDQPEDNISNSKIKDELIEKISLIRNDKQIIIITHNPLLIVNLDVDNVIYLEKNNRVTTIKNGPLEFSDKDFSILELIRDNIEGGLDAIEKRFKLYERDPNKN